MGVAVVTGANRGIGLALVRQLRSRGMSVVGVCRHSSPELDRLGVRIESGIDLASTTACVELAARFAHDEINLLIHNAGVFIEDTLGGVRADDVRAQLEINALAPLLLTQALSPLLAQGAKVALITSRMGSIGDNTSGGYYGYRMSKAALNAAGNSIVRFRRQNFITGTLTVLGEIALPSSGFDQIALLLTRGSLLNNEITASFALLSGGLTIGPPTVFGVTTPIFNGENFTLADFRASAPVPEPSALLLMAVGLIGLGTARRFRR